MSSPTPIIIEAVVADTEHPAIVAACQQLDDCLRAASGYTWPIELRFRPSIASVGSSGRPTLVILSLLAELARENEPAAITEARWRAQLGLLAPVAPFLLVCTIFRCVANFGAPLAPAASSGTLERIRRLNLLAAELSHDTGIGVLDIDRAFAHIGARELQTDYRLGGRLAAEAAAHTMVAGILAVALDDIVPADVQERAQQFHGGLSGIYAYVRRRLEQPATVVEAHHGRG